TWARLVDPPRIAGVRPPEPAHLHRRLLRLRRQRGLTAVLRLDDDRGAVLAFDRERTVAVVDPERVVAADVAGGTGGAVAADRRRFAVRIARREVRFLQLAHLRADLLRLFRRDVELVTELLRTLQRSQRGDVVRAGEIRSSFG